MFDIGPCSLDLLIKECIKIKFIKDNIDIVYNDCSFRYLGL